MLGRVRDGLGCAPGVRAGLRCGRLRLPVGLLRSDLLRGLGSRAVVGGREEVALEVVSRPHELVDVGLDREQLREQDLRRERVQLEALKLDLRLVEGLGAGLHLTDRAFDFLELGDQRGVS